MGKWILTLVLVVVCAAYLESSIWIKGGSIGKARQFQEAELEWSTAPMSSADACDQVWTALTFELETSTPTGNQFINCAPDGARLRTGFTATQ